MGNKNRSQRKTKIFTTNEGVEIDMGEYDEDFYRGLTYSLNNWLHGGYPSIISTLNSDEIRYIINHLEDSDGDFDIPSGHMTRVEDASHFISLGLDVGDTLDGNELFRSFSKDNDSTREVIDTKDQYWDLDEGWVIYRTVGNVPFFDPRIFANPYPNQTEVFVPVDTMKVEAIHDFGYEYEELAEFLGFNTIPSLEHPVKVVDISYDSSVQSVYTMSTGELDIDTISQHKYHPPRQV